MMPQLQPALAVMTTSPRQKRFRKDLKLHAPASFRHSFAEMEAALLSSPDLALGLIKEFLARKNAKATLAALNAELVRFLFSFFASLHSSTPISVEAARITDSILISLRFNSPHSPLLDP